MRNKIILILYFILFIFVFACQDNKNIITQEVTDENKISESINQNLKSDNPYTINASIIGLNTNSKNQIFANYGSTGTLHTEVSLYLSDYIAAGQFFAKLFLDENFYGYATYYSSAYNGNEVTYYYRDYISSLSPGTHTIRFEAITQIGTGESTLNFTVFERPPNPQVTNFYVSNYRAVIEWSSVSQASYYEIYRLLNQASSPAPEFGASLVGTVSQTSFTDNSTYMSGVMTTSEEDFYYYQVYAVNSNNVRSPGILCNGYGCPFPKFNKYSGTPPIGDN